MTDLFDIRNKSIVITGGGGVLCGEMARALAAAGARVAVLDLFEAAAAKVVDRINSAGGKADCRSLQRSRQRPASPPPKTRSSQSSVESMF